ncbi:fimbrial protein [Salmonella enterica subsp. enterica]|nr:fimbrial protein [Salmonella enterica subsp. enterica serovar Rubislaw]EEA7823339.1 fimbrial protein [Salmonella enterica subsp. enterica serovar Miami]
MSRLTFCFPPRKWSFLLCLFVLTLLHNMSADAEEDKNPTQCSINGSSNFTLNLSNVLVESYEPGVGKEVYNSGIRPISYHCHYNKVDGSSTLRAKLRINIANNAALITQLERIGLKMQIGYSGPNGQGLAWYDLNEVRDFASLVTANPGGDIYSSFDFALRISTISGFSGVVKTQVLAIRPLISISLGSGDVIVGTGLNINTSDFYLSLIPRCFGKVDITPSVISFGHIYISQSSVNKQASFTITARRDTACMAAGSNDSYSSFNLTSTFAPASGNYLPGNNRSLLLTADNSNGSSNGLELSLQDESAAPVPFNTSIPFGKLQKDVGNNNASLTRRYTAHLTGHPLLSGPFSAAVVVTITYE